MKSAALLPLAPLLPLALALHASPTGAQEPLPAAPGFDPDRAILSDQRMFDPFLVTDTEPLEEALDEGRVREDTPLLVVEREGQRLGLLTLQMAYHHVAQGELAGEPWMVAF